jgi:hypothetical protein
LKINILPPDVLMETSASGVPLSTQIESSLLRTSIKMRLHQFKLKQPENQQRKKSHQRKKSQQREKKVKQPRKK